MNTYLMLFLYLQQQISQEVLSLQQNPYYNSLVLFFCMTTCIKIKKSFSCCTLCTWTVLKEIFYLNAMVRIITIINFPIIQFYIKIVYQGMAPFYDSVMIFSRDIYILHCSYFETNRYSSIIPIKRCHFTGVVSHELVAIFFWLRSFPGLPVFKGVSSSKMTSSYLSTYFGFLNDFIIIIDYIIFLFLILPP